MDGREGAVLFDRTQSRLQHHAVVPEAPEDAATGNWLERLET